MHELGLMTSVIDAVSDAARKSKATRILSVTLSVGEMTEVIEDCLEFAYEALTEDNPLFKDSKLTINMVKPKSRCLECGNEFEHDRFNLSCPQCQSFSCQLIAGRDMTIDSIEVDIPDKQENE